MDLSTTAGTFWLNFVLVVLVAAFVAVLTRRVLLAAFRVNKIADPKSKLVAKAAIYSVTQTGMLLAVFAALGAQIGVLIGAVLLLFYFCFGYVFER